MDKLAKEYEDQTSKLNEIVEARRKLVAQEQENVAVKEELDKLKDENQVYKLIGPGLVKQDQAEAKSNVNKRLEYIRGETKRVEGQISDLEKAIEKIKSTILEYQQQNQPAQGTSETGAAA